MATNTTKTCDKCGTKLDGRCGELDGVVRAPATDWWIFHTWRSKHYDLCADCSKALIYWIGDKHE